MNLSLSYFRSKHIVKVLWSFELTVDPSVLVNLHCWTNSNYFSYFKSYNHTWLSLFFFLFLFFTPKSLSHTYTCILTQTITLHCLGIIRIIMNNTWVSPLPLAPTTASYWLWHTATHSLLSAGRSVCLSSCGTSTQDAPPTIRPHFPRKKKISAGPWPQQSH